MERTKKTADVVTSTEPPRWKKIGGGSLRIGGRIIKPGQIFQAWPDEISPAFRRSVQSMDGVTFAPIPVSKDFPPSVAKVTYAIKHRSGGMYHVLDSTGKILTEKALPKEEALKLVESMQK